MWYTRHHTEKKQILGNQMTNPQVSYKEILDVVFIKKHRIFPLYVLFPVIKYSFNFPKIF